MKTLSSSFRRLSITNFLLVSLVFISCTNYDKTHTVKWIGAFMLDSVNAGAIRLEYTQERPTNNTFADSKVYNIEQALYIYNFSTDRLIRSETLRDNLSEIPFENNYDFNFPYLAYETESGADRNTSIYDVLLKKNIATVQFIGFLSSTNKYLVNDQKALEIATKEEIKISNKEARLFYFDDSDSAGYGLVTALRAAPYPVIKTSFGTAIPETLGTISYWNILKKSEKNNSIIFTTPEPYLVSELRISSLKSKITELIGFNIGSEFQSLNAFDYDSISGNCILISNGNTQLSQGLGIGNLRKKFATKIISPSFSKDK